MSAESTVNSIISNATTTANTARDKAIEYANQAQTAAAGILVDLGRVHDPEEPNVTIPPFSPQEDLSSLFSGTADNVDEEFKTDFTDKTNYFLNTWFPDFAGCLKTNIDGWICSTIADGGTGIPAAIENQIWERSRNKETKEAARLKSEAQEAFASRGFSLPAGVLYAQLAMIDQEAANKVSTHARDVAIKQVDIEIENIRFAVDQGIRLRLGVVQALIGYLNAFFDAVPNLATDRAARAAELKGKLWDTSAAYYRALIDAARLTLDYDKLLVDKDLTIEGHTVESFARHIEARVNAAVAAAEGMGKIAGAALSAQNTLAEISSQTITSS
jgi:hypothetical protein